MIDGMSALLKSNIDTVSPSQYGEAKWFLLCVGYEAQQPLDAAPPPLPPPAASEVEPAEQTAGAEVPPVADDSSTSDEQSGGSAEPVDVEVQAFFKS